MGDVLVPITDSHAPPNRTSSLFNSSYSIINRYSLPNLTYPQLINISSTVRAQIAYGTRMKPKEDQGSGSRTQQKGKSGNPRVQPTVEDEVDDLARPVQKTRAREIHDRILHAYAAQVRGEGHFEMNSPLPCFYTKCVIRSILTDDEFEVDQVLIDGGSSIELSVTTFIREMLCRPGWQQQELQLTTARTSTNRNTTNDSKLSTNENTVSDSRYVEAQLSAASFGFSGSMTVACLRLLGVRTHYWKIW